MSYTDKMYYDRQCIVVVNDDRGLRTDEIDVFTRMNLPSDITFSDGRASLNKLYIAHPARKNLYIPLADHELIFFRDKMDELTMLLQALGATDIEIVRTQGLNAEQLNRSKSSTNISGGWKSSISAEMSYDSAQTNRNANAKANGFHLKIKSDSNRYPFVPNGLQWYKITPEWEKMVKQRLLGLEEYELELRSSYSSSISSSQMESLKLAAKVIFAKVSFSYSSEYENDFKETGEIVWGLKIKFRPLREYSGNDKTHQAPQSDDSKNAMDPSDNSSSTADKRLLSYRESCKSLIPTNGKISDAIRIELNRLREILGITADEATLIEREFLNLNKWFWPF